MRGRTAAEYALRQAGAPYVYGATGVPCTPRMRRGHMKQYPQMASAIAAACPVLSGKQGGCAGCRYRGRLAFDCAQLTRRALEQAGLFLPSGATSQWRFHGLEGKGPLITRAKSEVCLLFAGDGKTMRHVGLSLGNGLAADARSHQRGVVIARITAYPWTHCAFLPGEGEEGLDSGLVYRAQTRLLALGFPLPRYGADGRMGRETRAAILAFKKTRGLPETAALDQTTRTAMNV